MSGECDIASAPATVVLANGIIQNEYLAQVSLKHVIHIVTVGVKDLRSHKQNCDLILQQLKLCDTKQLRSCDSEQRKK